MASLQSEILANVGGVDNVEFLTHCATRLRFTLHDVSAANVDALDALDGVLGVVPQGNTGVQVVIGGAVASVYDDIMHEPGMASRGDAGSDGDSPDDVKAAVRAKARGKNAIVDAFFEYLSDSFRPLLGVLLGASLFITFAAVLDALAIVPFGGPKGATWVFLDAMWRSVFYFLPIMVAYNAAKKLRIDPWVGAAVMAAVMTPEFIKLQEMPGTECIKNEVLGSEQCTAYVFGGLPMQLNGYGGQVFVPLIMVALLALVYKAFQKVIPSSVHMVFIPFLSMAIMIPMTAFLIGPLGIWMGNGLGFGLAWLNTNAPIVFAIIIPLLYPFLVPLGLHWPLNALMLINIQTLGYDFIQGPMGTWNFACFGATAGVLFLSMRDKDKGMTQTAAGALAAGLFGGISEPSLYGIHLRYKRIYPLMLVGCLVGGLTVGIGGGIKASAFVFTSLLTIPAFDNIPLYVIAIALAFFTAMMLVIFFDYRTAEQKAAAKEAKAVAAADAALATGAAKPAPAAAAAPAGTATATAVKEKTALVAGTVTTLNAPLQGRAMELEEIPDPVFAQGTMGRGVGVDPTGNQVIAPASGTIVVAPDSGHAVGLKLDSGIELLVHVGIDTVQMGGKGFQVHVSRGDRVEAGTALVTFDRDAIVAAGYSPVTAVLVTNTKKFASVEGPLADNAVIGAPLVQTTAKSA